MNAYLEAMRRYATVNGRASRYDYWIYALAFAAIMFGALILESILGLGSNDVRPLMGLVSIAHFVPNLAITARRLHDIDRSAWWMLLYLTVVGGIVIIIFTLLPGTKGPNTFGDSTDDMADEASGHLTRSRTQPAADVTGELQKLSELRRDGAISDDEFELMKSRLLQRA